MTCIQITHGEELEIMHLAGMNWDFRKKIGEGCFICCFGIFRKRFKNELAPVPIYLYKKNHTKSVRGNLIYEVATSCPHTHSPFPKD